MVKGGIDSGGRKRTRFPCLATVRYVVASVVSVLTVAVVVTVIIVALRPEKVIFSIPHQYILADRQWWDDAPAEQAPIPSRVGGGGRATTSTTTTAGRGEVSVSVGGDDTESSYSPVKNVSFLVSFTAENPSGRADVSGKDVTIRVLAMPNYDESSSSSSYFQTTNLTEIITHKLKDGFSVNRQTSHTMREWILVAEAHVLYYLAEKYGGWTGADGFTAMVHVNATISRAGGASRNGGEHRQIYYCWPVPVFVLGRQPSYYYYRSTSCRLEKEMDATVSYSPPVLAAPAPAPMAAARY